MTFIGYKKNIQEGDLVLAFLGRDSIKPITIRKDEILNTRFGSFKHADMIGMRYGSQITSSKGYGFIHLLQPSAELWTLSLPHRTQIVYTPDSSYIIQRLGITVGSRIIEAGTGSASFSHASARTVSEEGRLFTYEFHESRFLDALKEFEAHGLLHKPITLCHRDVCKDGFEISDLDEPMDVTSVFLDLPSPWDAIPHLNSVICKRSRISFCSFSPCIEQVSRTLESLQKHGWTSLQTVEIQGRKWEARQQMVRQVDDAILRLKDIKKRKLKNLNRKRKLAVEKDELTDITQCENNKNHDIDKEYEPDPSSHFNPFGRGLRIKDGDQQYSWINVSKHEAEVKSHTSYLTFALKQVQLN